MRIWGVVFAVAALAAVPAQADYFDLLTAARTGDTRRLAALLTAGESVAAPEYHSGYSPLQFAAGNGDAEMTRALLEAGADTEYRDHNGDRPILWAAQRGHLQTVALLLDAGSPPDSPHDPYGQTPLMEAASYGGNVETVALLLAAGADPNRFDHSGDTALHYAARYDQVDIIRALLEAGANPNVISSILIETPLHEAALRGSVEAVRLLIDAGAAVEAQTKDGETPIWLAAMTGKAESVAALLAAHADPNLPRRDGQTPIHAAMSGLNAGSAAHEATGRLLAERTDDRDGALVAALGAGFQSVARRLLVLGADVNGTDAYGVPALAAATALPGTELLETLLEHGADLTRFGGEALAMASANGRDDLVTRLLGLGVDVDSRTENGATPLMMAAVGGHVDVARLLLEAGADGTATDATGRDVAAYMEIRPALIEYRISTRQASRAWRPTEHLEVELEDLTERHAAIRDLVRRHLAKSPGDEGYGASN